MKTSFQKKLKAFLPTLFGVVFLLVLWTVCFAAVGNEYLLVSPWETLKAAVRLFGTKAFYGAFAATFLRAFAAVLLSAAVAFPLAVLAFLFPKFGAFLAPTLATLRSLPTLAVLLLLLVWLGGNGATVAVGVTATLPMLYTALYTALSGVDGDLKELCEAYRVPVLRRIKGLYLPKALPKTVAEGGAAASFALKITVSAEILATTAKSLGGMMQEARLLSELATLTALTLCVCAVGIVIEGLTLWISRGLEKRFL